MQKETETQEESLSEDYTGSEIRIRQNIQRALAQQATVLVEEFMRVQDEHQKFHKDTVARRVEIVVGDSESAEEKVRIVQECLSQGTHVFAGTLRGKAQAALDDVESTHHDLVQLERKISQLVCASAAYIVAVGTCTAGCGSDLAGPAQAKLFQDLALLVSTQGEQLDKIETVLGQATAYAGQGVAELERANSYRHRKRKCWCCLGWLVGLVLLIMFGPSLLETLISGSLSTQPVDPVSARTTNAFGGTVGA
jgi:t-SNARE complex subunit (syntaxin)